MEVNQIFDVLPAEILCYIFQYLRIEDALKVSEVCKYFRELITYAPIYDYDRKFEVTKVTTMILNCPSYIIYSDINDSIPNNYLVNLFRKKRIELVNNITDVSPFSQAKEVSVYGVNMVDNFEYLKDVKRLILTNVELDLLVLDKVKYLEIDNVDINNIEGYNNLKYLKADKCEEDANFIENFINLEKLSVSDYMGEESLNLSGLKNLKYLCIGKNSKDKIIGFEKLDELEEIEITYPSLYYGEYSKKIKTMENLKKINVVLNLRDWDLMRCDLYDDYEAEEEDEDENDDTIINNIIKKLIPNGCEIKYNGYVNW